MSDESVAAPSAELPGIGLEPVRAEYHSPAIHLILKMPHLAVRGRDAEGAKALETLCHDFFHDLLKTAALMMSVSMRLMGAGKEQAVPFLQTFLAATAQNALTARAAADEILGTKKVVVATELPR